MGKTGKPKSFAAAAAQPAKASKPANQPLLATAIPGRLVSHLTHAQLNTLPTKQQVINTIKIRFRTQICNPQAAKGALVALYLRLAKDNPYKDQVVPVSQADAYVAA